MHFGLALASILVARSWQDAIPIEPGLSGVDRANSDISGPVGISDDTH